VLKNSAPDGNPKTFSPWKIQTAVGRNNLVVAGFPHGHQHPRGDGTDRDFEWNQPFSSGGWSCSAPRPIHFIEVSGALISKMDSTQHDRGWVMAAENGMISVMLGRPGAKGTTTSRQALRRVLKKSRCRR